MYSARVFVILGAEIWFLNCLHYKKQQGIIESILFAAGRQVEIKELMSATELGQDEIIGIIEMMKNEYSSENRGIEIIKVNDSFQLTTKKKYYEYIYHILAFNFFDKYLINFINRQIQYHLYHNLNHHYFLHLHHNQYLKYIQIFS